MQTLFQMSKFVSENGKETNNAIQMDAHNLIEGEEFDCIFNCKSK